MKILKVTAVATLFALNVNAQEAPEGFEKGSITLPDNTVAAGFVKENIRKGAAIWFISASGGKKKKYDGSELIAAETADEKFLCIKGDFFRIICNGDLAFLQKASDASGKPTYNGIEAVFSNGTEGKPNDYFLYDNKVKKLQLVSKKNLDEVVKNTFAGNTAALEKAKTVNGDLAQLKDAVDIYNNKTN
jgi:hypothetical protein